MDVIMKDVSVCQVKRFCSWTC